MRLFRRWLPRLLISFAVLAAFAAALVRSWTQGPGGRRIAPVYAVVFRIAKALERDGTPPPLTPADRARLDWAISLFTSADDEVLGVGATELTIPGPAGPIPARAYIPTGGGLKPLVVFFHGGGWVLGSIETHDQLARLLAAQADAVVVSVAYRLAPEHKFPAGFDDAYAAVAWLAEHATQVQADGARVAVAGDSAGGNLAAAVALRARDEGGPKLRAQALMYPPLDLARFESKSWKEIGQTGYGVTEKAITVTRGLYLASAEDYERPYVSPLRAASLAGVPPALVVEGEFDPLRDEGEAYVERIRKEGGDATYRRFDGVGHGFVSLHGWLTGVPEGAAAVKEIAAFLKERLAG